MRIPQQHFVSLSPPKKQTHTISATIVLTLWIDRTGDELKLHLARKGACTVISPSFPGSVDLVARRVQRRFALREKFQKLFNDREERVLGSLRKPRRQRQRERRYTEGLMSRAMIVLVRYNSLYISLPSSAAKQQREMIKFYVV